MYACLCKKRVINLCSLLSEIISITINMWKCIKVIHETCERYLFYCTLKNAWIFSMKTDYLSLTEYWRHIEVFNGQKLDWSDKFYPSKRLNCMKKIENLNNRSFIIRNSTSFLYACTRARTHTHSTWRISRLEDYRRLRFCSHLEHDFQRISIRIMMYRLLPEK